MHILDADTLLAIPERAAAGRLHELSDMICDLIQNGEATFPTTVKNEAVPIAGDAHSSWIRAIAGSCSDTALPYAMVIEVLGGCPDAMDQMSEQEPSQVYVAATALYVATRYENVVVVTDEVSELPDRRPLAQVCDVLDIKRCTSTEFYIEFDMRGLVTH